MCNDIAGGYTTMSGIPEEYIVWIHMIKGRAGLSGITKGYAI